MSRDAAVLFIALTSAMLLAFAACAAAQPVSLENTALGGAYAPEKNVIIRIALEFLQKELVLDRFDPDSAAVIFRNREAHFVEIKLYPWVQSEKRSSLVKVYAMDGWAEWSSYEALQRLR